MQMGFVFLLRMFQDKCNRAIAIVIIAIVIDYLVILFIRDRN